MRPIGSPVDIEKTAKLQRIGPHSYIFVANIGFGRAEKKSPMNFAVRSSGLLAG